MKKQSPRKILTSSNGKITNKMPDDGILPFILQSSKDIKILVMLTNCLIYFWSQCRDQRRSGANEQVQPPEAVKGLQPLVTKLVLRGKIICVIRSLSGVISRNAFQTKQGLSVLFQEVEIIKISISVKIEMHPVIKQWIRVQDK